MVATFRASRNNISPAERAGSTAWLSPFAVAHRTAGATSTMLAYSHNNVWGGVVFRGKARFSF